MENLNKTNVYVGLISSIIIYFLGAGLMADIYAETSWGIIYNAMNIFSGIMGAIIVCLTVATLHLLTETEK